MTARNDATRAQIQAALPDTSTWLAANAGSGKTRVLTDRVARLLLDGVEPQRILCLTYTKAAASEMQNRLFKRLGAWAMLDESSLTQALRDLGIDGPIEPARLRDARTLFARAIETPGGLKIQTIHSFCASLLRRFPLEAGVSPQFTEIEDRAADLLRAEIIDTMAEDGDADAITALARHYTGENFGKLSQSVVKYRDGFAPPLDWAGCLGLFDQPVDLTEDAITKQVFLGSERDLLDQVNPVLLAGSSTDAKAGARLHALGALDFDSLPQLETVFLTGPKAKAAFSAKVGSFPTKATQQKLSDSMPSINALMQRVEDARAQRVALIAARKTHALHQFAARFLPRYEEAKTLRGWLDFDDLIDRARALLSDEKVAAWVLWRIDGGIDHILVDEAQDTSPAQWDVIRKLAAEFTSGQGARTEDTRTIFVVGDKKQSIYSFQGADPRQFDEMQTEFAEKIQAVDRAFQSRTLAFSFRSASAVLDLVDRTFDGQEDAGFTKDAEHFAFKELLPGRVDLWPVIEPQPDDEDGPWYQPLDRRGSHHHTVLLADRVAGQIDRMITSKQLIPDDTEQGGHHMRPVQAGDFLILVQTRGALFSEIIRACKAHALPIAGADRLKVGGELAVRDLAALLSFLAVPEDNLSLASALKSPLFGWSEQDLFDLAHRRTQDHLWQALRDRSEEFPQTMAIINDLRRNVDFLRPYDLIERVLTRHKARRHLLARLGTEAEDGINALLSQALAYERNAVPSLTGFLSWMETDDLEIKRQIDSNSNQIRVMTVHGAKGLEAPIVILPDCGRRLNVVKDDIIKIGETPVWKTAADDAPYAMGDALDAIKMSQAQERLRLLYVALTRAEKWLIVAAAGELSKENDTWYQMVDAALDAAGAQAALAGDLPVKRVENGDWSATPTVPLTKDAAPEILLHPCFAHAAPPPADKTKTISPSDLPGAKALAGESGRSEDAAMAYGTLVHSFLEHLASVPQNNWPEVIANLRSADSSDADHLQAQTEAQNILLDPTLRYLFDDTGLSEVAITADLGDARLHGVIDRLVFTDDAILAVDFKTNQTVPHSPEACPEGILRQMAAYLVALQQIYPDRRVQTAVLWTNAAQLMLLRHEIVIQSLQNTPYLDATAPAT